MFSSEARQGREDTCSRCSLGRTGSSDAGRKKVQPFLADGGCSELNASTPTYFSGFHRPVQVKKGKTERQEDEVRGRKKNQLQKHHLQRTLDTVKVILSLLALSAQRAGQGQLLGQRGDPGEPGARAPLSAVLHGTDGGQRPGGLPTRTVAAAQGIWDYLSSPALERCCLLRGSKRQALVRP